MLKKILKLNGAQELTNSIKKNINGGLIAPYCSCTPTPKTGYIKLCTPNPECDYYY